MGGERERENCVVHHIHVTYVYSEACKKVKRWRKTVKLMIFFFAWHFPSFYSPHHIISYGPFLCFFTLLYSLTHSPSSGSSSSNSPKGKSISFLRACVTIAIWGLYTYVTKMEKEWVKSDEDGTWLHYAISAMRSRHHMWSVSNIEIFK